MYLGAVASFVQGARMAQITQKFTDSAAVRCIWWLTTGVESRYSPPHGNANGL